jgi:hypothetical protein
MIPLGRRVFCSSETYAKVSPLATALWVVVFLPEKSSKPHLDLLARAGTPPFSTHLCQGFADQFNRRVSVLFTPCYGRN